MSSSSPRFSILVAVYNRPDLVRETIESVLRQTHSSFELIVVDDGSTDKTPEVLETYAGRITVLTQVNSGAEAARSRAMGVAQGDYLVGLDSDDLLYPDALATYDRVLRELKDPPLLLGAMSYFCDAGRIPENRSREGEIEFIKFKDAISKDRTLQLTYSCLVIKRSAAVATGALRRTATAFPFDMPDVLLLAGTCSPFVVLLKPFTVAYRVHGSNTVRNIGYIVENVSRLAALERGGHYPGGNVRRWERYAYIGTMCGAWALKGLRHRQFGRVARLLVETAPMILAGVIELCRRRLHRPIEASVLPRES